MKYWEESTKKSQTSCISLIVYGLSFHPYFYSHIKFRACRNWMEWKKTWISGEIQKTCTFHTKSLTYVVCWNILYIVASCGQSLRLLELFIRAQCMCFTRTELQCHRHSLLSSKSSFHVTFLCYRCYSAVSPWESTSFNDAVLLLSQNCSSYTLLV